MPLDEGDWLYVLLVLLPIVCLAVATLNARIQLSASARTSAAVVVLVVAALSLGHAGSVNAGMRKTAPKSSFFQGSTTGYNG